MILPLEVDVAGISKINLKIEEGENAKDYSNSDLVVCKTFDNISKSNVTLNALDNIDLNASYFEWVDRK